MCLTFGFGYSLLALTKLFPPLTLEFRSTLVGLSSSVLKLTEGLLVRRRLDMECKGFDLPGQGDIFFSAIQFFFQPGRKGLLKVWVSLHCRCTKVSREVISRLHSEIACCTVNGGQIVQIMALKRPYVPLRGELHHLSDRSTTV
jgi:hypothetical protein